ncbi:MAG: hypothetical protein OXC11_05790 [Rhodospirillales bacterium]|nr:hypothetical protein [Rhodospirillales bacterium]
MSAAAPRRDRDVRYEANEIPPAALVLGCGLQLVVLGIASIVLIPTIVIQVAGATESYLSWAVFAAVVVSGISTALQAVRLGRIGAGYVLTMGPAGAYIGVCVTALIEGGPTLLATLVVASSLVPIVISMRLALFRRLLTPTIVGTVNMLVPATVLPVVFTRLTDAAGDPAALEAPLTALATILVISGISLKGGPTLRLWAPLAGVVSGSVVAGFLGLYDPDLLSRAQWIGLPEGGWPGIGLDLGPAYVELLPAFVFVALIGAIQTITGAVAIQRVSWRRARAVDYRAVEGAVAADGIGKLLSGLAGIMPTQTIAVSVPTVELTGVAARRVGIAAGGVLIVLAFLPKVLAAILAIPGPVVVAYLTVVLAMSFVRGMTEVVQDGIDHRKALIAGVAFWVGVGCQNDLIFPELLSELAGGLLSNGITAGGLVAIFLTLFLEATAPSRSRIEVALDLSVLPKIREFLGAFASRSGWGEQMVHRLDAASEETLLALLGEDDSADKRDRRRLLLQAREEGGGAVLEFIAAAGEENVQDRIGLLAETPDDVLMEREVSLRLLRHIASTVRHQQFHDSDIVTIRVEAPEVRHRNR